MRQAHRRERDVGIEYYVSDTDGIGGRLKAEPADFRVQEIEDVAFRPLDDDPDAYPHVVVRATLTGWDTFAFAGRLAGDLGIDRERIRWAGTKDKEAVTTQLFSIQDIEPGDLPAVSNAEIEPVGRFGRGLGFGDLLGNAFDLRVRDASHPDREPAITTELTEFGRGTVTVPNYFGPQRFGSVRPVTHRVGMAILDGDWEAAVMRYLGEPTAEEPPDTQAAREFVEESREWETAIERFPRRLDHERRMLHRLAESDGDDADAFRDALDAVPRSLRQLFVHAAQSYLFNRILSERLARDIPLVEARAGDVVCFARRTDELGAVPDPDRTQRVTPERVETVNRHVTDGRAFVTAPLIGTDTELGDGAPGQIERQVLATAGIERADFDLPEPYDSSGTRRAVVVRTELAVEEALRFRFALPSGSYATVLMREYLKVDPGALS